MQEKQQGTRQKARMKRSKELGKKVCKKSRNELGKIVCKKVARNQARKYA